MKFVPPLTEAERITLLQAREQGPRAAALWRRAQAVELSSRDYRLNTVAELLEIHRQPEYPDDGTCGPAKGSGACLIFPAAGDP